MRYRVTKESVKGGMSFWGCLFGGILIWCFVASFIIALVGYLKSPLPNVKSFCLTYMVIWVVIMALIIGFVIYKRRKNKK